MKSTLEKMMSRAKEALRPEPPRRALDAETGEPIPLAVRTTLERKIGLAIKAASGVAYFADLIPGKWAALAFAVGSCAKDLLMIVGDYLDNGKADRSYSPEAP